MTRIKRHENEVFETLCSWGYYPSLSDSKGPCGDVSNLRRADFVLHSHDMDYVILIEVDEDFHKRYPAQCEIAKLSDLRDQYVGKYLYIIRYGVKRHNVGTHGSQDYITSGSKKELKAAIDMIITSKPDKCDNIGYKIVYIGYPEERIEELDDQHKKMQESAMALIEEQKREEFRERKRLEKRLQRQGKNKNVT